MTETADPLSRAIEELKRRVKTTVFKPKPKAARSSGFASVPPLYPSHALPIDEAEMELRRQMTRFFDAVSTHAADAAEHKRTVEEAEGSGILGMLSTPLSAPVAPVMALAATTGLGKTRAAAKSIQRFLGGNRKGRVCFAAPTLELADQVAEDFRRAGLSEVHVYRGRNADDPDAEGKTMCLDMQAVKLALEAGASDIQKACCQVKQRGKDPIQCAFFDTCGYQRQKREKPRVWIIAHALLFRGGGDLPEFDALFIDESFWREGLPDKPFRTTVRSLYTTPAIRRADGSLDLDSMNDLEMYRRTLMAALEANGTGPVRADILLEHGISAETASAARKLEFMRKTEADGMYPGMPLQERQRIAKEAAETAKALRDAGLWKSVRDCVELTGSVHSGRMRLVERQTDAGPVLELESRPLGSMSDRWAVPTLILDATLPADEIMAAYHPQVRTFAPIEVEPPASVTVRQVVEAPVTSTKLGINEWAKTGGDRNIRDLARFIKAVAAAHYPATVGVIAQQAAVVRFRECHMPPNVAFRHFNALRGLNDWKSVRSLIVLGHVLPPAPEVENIAAVLTGVDRLRVQADEFGRLLYERHTAGIRTPDGQGAGVTVARHPDPVTEAVRKAVCDAELVQAIGRARAIRRTDETPLDLWLIADEVLPVTVNEVWKWADVVPGVWAEMVGSGMILNSAADAAKCFPDVFASQKAAEHLKERGGFDPHSSKEDVLYRAVGVKSTRYRPAGRGQQTRTAEWLPHILPAPRPWLEARLGPLTIFEAEGVDPKPDKAGDDFAAIMSALPFGGCSHPFDEPPASFCDVAAFC